MKYVLATALILLALSVPGINFYHHLSLPTSHPSRITSQYIISTPFPYVHTKYDIRLESEIKNKERFDDITQVLQDSSVGDQVIFHLSGYGGEVQTTQGLINNVWRSKADVIMIVEAPVYSAHAYLAVSGDKLVMDPLSFLMFHSSSILNWDCAGETGMDRGVSNQEHCMLLKTNILLLENEMIDRIELLTEDEKTLIRTGHDVYIQSAEFYDRVHRVMR